MIQVKAFTFNPFAENTYILYDETKSCIIIDPGCYSEAERKALRDFIVSEQLNPERLINTHCHIDHVFGNQFIVDQYGLELEIHQGELPVLESVPLVAEMYQIPLPDTIPNPGKFISEEDQIRFGNEDLKVLFTPGHSPASISLYSASSNLLIAGDVLFEGSIGRTDLPGGDKETLLHNIRTKFFTLPPNTVVYPGHGNATTIGREIEQNPFFQ